MSVNELDQLVPGRRYFLEEDGVGNESMREQDDFLAVDSDAGEVNLHLSPRTDDVVTVSLSPEGAWKLIRKLARCAVEAEI